MSKKNKHRSNQERPIEDAAEKNTKKTLKPVPVWKSEDGTLLKLKRSDFPYNRNGIIAYCDYRTEYWRIKKQEMLKKVDPSAKLRLKREKLLKALGEVNAQLETDEKTDS